MLHPKIPIRGNSGFHLGLFQSDASCFSWANVSLKLSTAKNSQGPEYFCSVHFTSGWGRDKFHFTSVRRKGKQNTQGPDIYEEVLQVAAAFLREAAGL